MNKILNLGIFLAVTGFLLIAVTGVDLVTSRIGLGLLILGLGGLLAAVTIFIKPSEANRFWLSILTCFGSGYFIWRALWGGPIGLAIPDVVLVLAAIAAYLALLASGRTGRMIFIVALAVVCVTNVGVALAQAFGGKTFLVWQENSDKDKLVTGLFGHYNPFSGFLNGSVFFFLSYLFLGGKNFWRVFCGVLGAGILFGLIYSGSRGGWVSFVAGGAIWLLVVLTYLKQRNSRYFGIALISGIFVSVLGIASSYWVVQKLTNERANRDREAPLVESPTLIDDGGRMAFQQLAFEIFQDAPVIGAGPRAYSYLSLSYWDTEKRRLRERPPVFAHNEYLQVLSDYGLVGLVIVIVLLLAHVVHGVFRALTWKEVGAGLSIWQIGAVGGMISILAQCFFSFLLHVPACILLLAIHAGFLASRGESQGDEGTKCEGWAILGRLRGSFGIFVSVVILIFGVILSKSYFLAREANRQIASATDGESALQALETLKSAGDMGRDPKIFEVAGRLAMGYANEPSVRKAPDLVRGFYLSAKDAFESALSYNPHFPAGIAGLPRVEDALGNWKVAEAGHKNAMEKLWMREYQLRPFYHAAQSSRRAAFRGLYAGNKNKALGHFRVAHRRLIDRREILVGSSREVAEDKELRFEIEAWIAYLEAGLLFKEGDHVWKKARPRNPELAHALMLEAQKRYQVSQKVVSKIDPSWEKQVKQLQVNLGYLEAGQVRPAKLSQEQIAEIVGSEAGLDSLPSTR